jgi:hypothetical protein
MYTILPSLVSSSQFFAGVVQGVVTFVFCFVLSCLWLLSIEFLLPGGDLTKFRQVASCCQRIVYVFFKAGIVDSVGLRGNVRKCRGRLSGI